MKQNKRQESRKKLKKAEEEKLKIERESEKRRDIFFYCLTAGLFFLIFVLGAQ